MRRFRTNESDNQKFSLKSIAHIIKIFNLKKQVIFLLFFSTLVNSLLANAVPWLIGFAFDYFFNPQTFTADKINNQFYIIFIVILIGVMVLYTLLTMFVKWFTYHINLKFKRSIRLKMYKKLQQMPISYFENTKTGNLMSSLTNDVENLTVALEFIMLEIIPAFFFFVVIIILMVIYSPILALVIIIGAPLMLIPAFILIKKNQKRYNKIQNKIGDYNAFLEENIDTIPLITVHQQQEKVSKQYQKIIKDLAVSELKIKTFWNFLTPMFDFIKIIFTIIIVTTGSLFIQNGVYTGGLYSLTFGVLTSFTIYVNSFIDKITTIFDIVNSVQQGTSSLVRINEILNLKQEVKQNKLDKLKPSNLTIKFENVNFSYPSTPDIKTLSNVNFEIKEHQSLALVGQTGCGKTTISKLLAKFYVPTAGDIKIGNQSIFKVSENSWRDYISIILQDTFIFEDTLKNNLICANPDISEQEFIKICKLTKLDEFVTNLPNKYETILSRNGSNLSEGQRQLMSITRAILTKKPIIIMDEATSNIDTITEQYIQNAIKILMKQSTMLIIAHRLNTIRSADQILVIEQGRVIEQGTHDQLVNYESNYKHLYELGFEE